MTIGSMAFGRRERVRSWTQFIADSVIHQNSQPPSWDEVAQLANSYLGCDAWGPRRGMAIDGRRWRWCWIRLELQTDGS